MEIERKWLVDAFPEGLTPVKTHEMAQGYLCTAPTVRLRKEALCGGDTDYILCFKSGGGLSREEIELSISPETFDDLCQKILGKPLIPKTRHSYRLSDGHTLEVNAVDIGQPTAFFYAEIEFQSEAEALAWQPSTPALAAYLTNEVTNDKTQSMAAYWRATRG